MIIPEDIKRWVRLEPDAVDIFDNWDTMRREYYCTDGTVSESFCIFYVDELSKQGIQPKFGHFNIKPKVEVV